MLDSSTDSTSRWHNKFHDTFSRNVSNLFLRKSVTPGSVLRDCSVSHTIIPGIIARAESRGGGAFCSNDVLDFFSLLYKHFKLLLQLLSIIVACISPGKSDVDVEIAP